MAGAEDENFGTYKLLFENWRFQVQNNWQRSSYFAVFETAALAGAWSVIKQHDQHYCLVGPVFASLGAMLTLVWTFSNHRSGLYTSYWWESLCRLEGEKPDVGAGLSLVCGYDTNREDFGITKAKARPRSLRYPVSMQFVPTLFTFAWLGLLIMARKFDCVTLILCCLFLGVQFYLVLNDRKRPKPGGEDTRLKVLIGAAFLADVKEHPETRAAANAVLAGSITAERDREFLKKKGWL